MLYHSADELGVCEAEWKKFAYWPNPFSSGLFSLVSSSFPCATSICGRQATERKNARKRGSKRKSQRIDLLPHAVNGEHHHKIDWRYE
jgi:hypothetical protein